MNENTPQHQAIAAGNVTEPLDEVLATAHEDVAVLARSGHKEQAEHLEHFVRRVEETTETYRRWLSEPDAFLHSGLAPRTLRRRFREMLDAGNARYSEKRQREYRQSALPCRANIAAQRERGRRGETPQELAS